EQPPRVGNALWRERRGSTDVWHGGDAPCRRGVRRMLYPCSSRGTPRPDIRLEGRIVDDDFQAIVLIRYDASRPRARRNRQRAADIAAQRREIVSARREPDLRPAAHQHRHHARRVRVDHGALRRRQVHAASPDGHARQRVAGRVPLHGSPDTPDGPEGPRGGPEAVHRVCGSGLPSARQPDGVREPRASALVPRRQEVPAAGHGGRHPRSLQHRRKEGPLPDAALGRTAAARRHRPGGHRQPGGHPGRRAHRQPALVAGPGDDGPVQEAERGGHDDRAGHTFRNQRVLRQPHHTDRRRVDSEQPAGRVMPSAPRILIADDQPDVLEALRLLAKNEGYQIDTATSPAAILKALEAWDYDVVLMDLNYARDTTSGQEGLDLLTRIHSADESLPVVVMTAWGTVDIAVDAMRRGARDFIQKPWDNERLLTILRTQTELRRALRRSNRLEALTRPLHAQRR